MRYVSQYYKTIRVFLGGSVNSYNNKGIKCLEQRARKKLRLSIGVLTSQFIPILLFCSASGQKSNKVICHCWDALCRESSVLQWDKRRGESRRGANKRRKKEEKTQKKKKVEWQTIKDLSKAENTILHSHIQYFIPTTTISCISIIYFCSFPNCIFSSPQCRQ